MEINGLPLHPLVVHAAVVFGPLAAAAALTYVALPSWRDRLRWPMVVLALVAAGAIVTAYFTGNSFRGSKPFFTDPTNPISDKVDKHRQLGTILLWVTIGFAVVAALNAWLHDRAGTSRLALGGLLAVTALGVLVLTVLTGDAGAQAVWG